MLALHNIQSTFFHLSLLVAIIFLLLSIADVLHSLRWRSALHYPAKKSVDYKYCYNDASKSIYFLHLTNESNEWKRLEACAFKRAAELNGIGVCVLTAIEMEPHRALVGLSNLEFAPLDIERIVIGTTVHDWYVNIYSNKSAVGQFALYELSDGLRYSYLYKLGGYYLDTDTITLKNFTHLQNTTAYHDANNNVAAGILFFDKGHPLMKAVLDMIPSAYNPTLWGSIGPRLLPRVVHDGNVSNNTYQLLRKELYPTTYFEFELPFSNSSKEQTRHLVKNSYTLHLWRKYFNTKRHPVDYWKSGAIFPMGSFIQEICGTV